MTNQEEIYPSEITREQFELIKPILESAKKKTAPRKVDLFDVFNAILYVLREGCRWRSLPQKYPKWQLVYYYFRLWKEPREDEGSILEQVLEKLVENHRNKDARNKNTSFIIVDAQSVKNTETAEQKGYDGGKKISGIKRHIAVDSQGLPHAITVTTANVSDKAGAKQMIDDYKDSLDKVTKVLVDGGYTGNPFSSFIEEKLSAKVEVAKRSELHTFAVIPKRWVVERSFAWIERCRRLWKNCERKLSTSLAMLQLGFASVLLRRL